MGALVSQTTLSPNLSELAGRQLNRSRMRRPWLCIGANAAQVGFRASPLRGTPTSFAHEGIPLAWEGAVRILDLEASAMHLAGTKYEDTCDRLLAHSANRFLDRILPKPIGWLALTPAA